MVIWMMPWWDSLVIGGSGSLVFGPSARSESKWNTLTQVGYIHWRVFSEVVWFSAFSMDEAMNLWTFTGQISIQQHRSPRKVYDSRISRCLAARWSVCLGHPVSCGCGRWGSHATFPSHAWNVLWSGRVWCSLQDHSTPSDALCKLRRFNQENWVDTANPKILSLPVSLKRNFFLQVSFEICSCM